jgi:hypothetical protein
MCVADGCISGVDIPTYGGQIAALGVAGFMQWAVSNADWVLGIGLEYDAAGLITHITCGNGANIVATYEIDNVCGQGVMCSGNQRWYYDTKGNPCQIIDDCSSYGAGYSCSAGSCVAPPPPSCSISVSPGGTVGEGATQTIYWQGVYAYGGQSLAIYRTPQGGSQYLYWSGAAGDNPGGQAGQWPFGSWTYILSVSNASGSNSCTASWVVKPKPNPDSNLSAACPGIGDVLTMDWTAGMYSLNHLVVVDDKSNGWSPSANCTNGTGFNKGDWCGYVTDTKIATPSQSGHTYDISVYSSNDVGLGTPVKTSLKCPSGQCTDDGSRICYNDTVVNNCGQTQENCVNEGDICSSGKCVAQASCVPSSYTCADSTHRKDNCNNISACPAGQTCTGGVCAAPLCTVSTFSCANSTSRVDNCGNVYLCSAGQTCAGGVCYSAPNLTLTAVPLLVRKGQPTDLTWTSTNAASCTLVGTNGDSWTGINSTVSSCTHGSGSSAGACLSGNLSMQTTYTLTCTSPQGAVSNKSVSVNILPSFCEPGAAGC